MGWKIDGGPATPEQVAESMAEAGPGARLQVEFCDYTRHHWCPPVNWWRRLALTARVEFWAWRINSAVKRKGRRP